MDDFEADPWAHLALQLQRVADILLEEGHHGLAAPISIAAARAFADRLMLLPDEASARHAIQEDEAGARSFAVALRDARDRRNAGRISAPAEDPSEGLPFWWAANLSLEVLQEWEQLEN
jgi:hypothetical protein